MYPEAFPESVVFTASAPAKVILCGEHAVVYNQPAIAIPVSDLRVTVRIQRHQSGAPGLRLIAGDLERFLPSNVSFHEEQAVTDALELTVRLVLETLKCSLPGLTATIESQIPVASGLGSGAAVSAALGRALSAALGNPLDNPTLNTIVYEVEKIHHGTPSGIDNTVIVYEQPIFFVRNHPIQTFTAAAPFTLLIADTGRGALTKVAVGDVRRLYETEPERIKPILSAIGDLVTLARGAIENGDLTRLGALMTQNHAYLQQLTVSSDELDQLVRAALDAGALGAKLSGGGRGGNMIALVMPENKSAVRAALVRSGAKYVYETLVG
ncbi:MAG: mevalonate kinase [Chloroflexi bacterium]|nr:mevalonate kinase [Chloroflexota bacterium]MDL1882827.1 mevalonate kinase [Anaerolineae bacterium CFX8]